MPMSFIMSKNVEHSSEKTPKPRAQGEIYKFHTSVSSTHFFGQVQIFFFFTRCIMLLTLDSKPTFNSRTNRHLDWSDQGKKIWTIIFTSYSKLIIIKSQDKLFFGLAFNLIKRVNILFVKRSFFWSCSISKNLLKSADVFHGVGQEDGDCVSQNLLEHNSQTTFCLNSFQLIPFKRMYYPDFFPIDSHIKDI